MSEKKCGPRIFMQIHIFINTTKELLNMITSVALWIFHLLLHIMRIPCLFALLIFPYIHKNPQSTNEINKILQVSLAINK